MIDPSYYTVADGDGQTKAAREAGVDVGGDPRPAAHPFYAQQPARVQALQQMRAGSQVAAPALDAAMVEMRLHVPGVGATMLAHKSQHLLGARLHPGVPGARLPARMQQGQGLARAGNRS